ncbi:hypothetical protein [Methanococcus maripaludis]|uniref:Energy-converting hydrogenase Eha subunit A n=1 Tax=Methanococcus maripaludis TaxID=39152 RepID=A0A7J9PNZ3_METMI|nr:hypothetical protein [Methanococcus maripaludis]MBA2864436.1 energy-converting hydrogenase Eha subunit A [Methanococcus maripaludis]
MNTAIYSEKEKKKSAIKEYSPVFQEAMHSANAAIGTMVNSGIVGMNSMMFQAKMAWDWGINYQPNEAGNMDVADTMIGLLIIGIVLFVGPIVLGNLEPTMTASVPETSTLYNASVKTSENIGKSYEIGSVFPILVIAIGFIGLIINQLGIGRR